MVIEKLRPEWDVKVKEAEEKWRRIGYPERIIPRASERAREWLEGLTRIFDENRAPELAEAWQRANMDAAIRHSEKWMDEIIEAFAPERAEEIKRRKAELKLTEVVS